MTDLTPDQRVRLATLLSALASKDPTERGDASAELAKMVETYQLDWLPPLLTRHSRVRANRPAAAAPGSGSFRPPPSPPVPLEHEADLTVLLTNGGMLTSAERALAVALDRQPFITTEQRQNLAVAAQRVRDAGGWTPERAWGFRSAAPSIHHSRTRCSQASQGVTRD